MSRRRPNDYTLWIGIDNYKHAFELQRYVVILHKNNGRMCEWFSTSYEYRGPARDGVWKHGNRSINPRSEDHAYCENLYNKQFIGHVSAKDLDNLTLYFDCTRARESQFFVFRWLYLCADKGILRVEDVDRVRPVVEFGEGSMRYIDVTK
ncbi:hypothetical protein BDW74DRAFT_181231 [Aspergillus multicolor]|uniref:uncharacterized protein n=1 Tax=Aspergillus multicolor TaxID=41759 RepID=UPI003CCD4C98